MKKYQALVEDFDLQSPIRKHFMVFILSRRLILVFGVVFLHDAPIWQVVSAIVPNAVMLMLYLILKPHNSSKLNFIDAIVEMIFIAIHSLVLVLGVDDVE